MAECMPASGSGENSLFSLFDEGYQSYVDLNNSSESSSSDTYQNKIKSQIKQFEDATKLVSSLGMFSTNEDVEEISTSNIKFLLLPALLGSLSTKLTSADRRQLLEIAEIYFKDFLSRCRDYNIADVPENVIVPETAIVARSSGLSSELNDLSAIMQTRQYKINRFKEKKELEEKLAQLKQMIDNKTVDDEVERKYYLTLVQSWVAQSMEELVDINKEKPILDFMDKMKSANATEETQKAPRTQSKKLLKPVIITKGDIQKKIYGLGYPSIPVMTIDEFYEEKVKEGTFKVPDMSLQAMALTGQNRETQKEADEIQDERDLENDDYMALMKARCFDDWKDDNRRGDGNRTNMG